MTSIQEVTQVRLTHVVQSHTAKTFNGNHPLNVFEKVPNVRGIVKYLKRDPTNIVYSSNAWYPPVNLRV